MILSECGKTAKAILGDFAKGYLIRRISEGSGGVDGLGRCFGLARRYGLGYKESLLS